MPELSQIPYFKEFRVVYPIEQLMYQLHRTFVLLQPWCAHLPARSAGAPGMSIRVSSSASPAGCSQVLPPSSGRSHRFRRVLYSPVDCGHSPQRDRRSWRRWTLSMFPAAADACSRRRQRSTSAVMGKSDLCLRLRVLKRGVFWEDGGALMEEQPSGLPINAVRSRHRAATPWQRWRG